MHWLYRIGRVWITWNHWLFHTSSIIGIAWLPVNSSCSINFHWRHVIITEYYFHLISHNLHNPPLTKNIILNIYRIKKKNLARTRVIEWVYKMKQNLPDNVLQFSLSYKSNKNYKKVRKFSTPNTTCGRGSWEMTSSWLTCPLARCLSELSARAKRQQIVENRIKKKRANRISHMNCKIRILRGVKKKCKIRRLS